MKNKNMVVIPTGTGTAGTANPTIEIVSKTTVTTAHPHHAGSRGVVLSVDDDEVVVLMVTTVD